MAALEEQFASMNLQENTFLVHVKLLSGDILPITVQKECFLLALPNEFIRQAGYNPSLVSRLLFLDENGQNIREDPSWQKRFSQDIPLLHVLLLDEEDKDRQAKLDLFRKILRDKHLKTHLDQDAIWSMYSSWNITYAPSKKTNRYIKLLDFALAHPDVFQKMTHEEIQERKRILAEQKQRDHDLLSIQSWILYRERQEQQFAVRMTLPLFVQERERARDILQRSSYFSLFNDTRQGRANCAAVLFYFTTPELIAMGIPLHRITTEWQILQWEEYSAKAEAYLASQS